MDDPLTEREIEALRLIANGYTGMDAARQMGYSRTHLRYIIGLAMLKLGAKSRVQAVARAVAAGLVEVDHERN